MRRFTAATAGWLLVTALALGARAQQRFDPFEWQPAPADARSYQSTKERFADLLAVWDYPSVFRALLLDAEASPVWGGTEPAYRNLLQALEILDRRLEAFRVYLGGASDEIAAVDRFLAQVPTGLFQEVDQAFFPGTPFEVSFEDLEELPVAQGEDFRYRVDTVGRLLWDLRQPRLQESVGAIRAARARWDGFVEEGMSQYPWEAVFNGYLAPEGTIERPPSRQWVWLHPELGVEVNTDGFKDLRVKESLLVEGLGHVWYWWRDGGSRGARLGWVGPSAAASLREDMRPGVGVIGHWERLVTVGVVWHDADGDGAWFDPSPFVVLGIDLFRLVEDRAPAYQQRWQRVLEARDRLQP